MTNLEPLVALQERDLALDRLRHRRESLPVRGELAALESRLAERRGRVESLQSVRHDIAREEQRFEAEVQSLAEQAAGAERRLYSGEVASPRELQALQADVEQLRRHQRGVEDRQLTAMERREPLDAELAALEVEITTLEEETGRLRAALGAREAEIDAEVGAEVGARDEVAAGIDGALLDDYEHVRAKANGVGAARLVGNTCQGCHLTIPATEVDHIRRGADGQVAHCDNCGCILVP